MDHSAALAGDGLSGGRLHTAEGGTPTLLTMAGGQMLPRRKSRGMWDVAYSPYG